MKTKTKKRTKTNMYYDSDADMLIIQYLKPYLGQEVEEIKDGIFAYINPKTGKVEGLQILSFKKRFSKSFNIDIPSVVNIKAG